VREGAPGAFKVQFFEFLPLVAMTRASQPSATSFMSST